MSLCINMWCQGNNIVMSCIPMVMLQSLAFYCRKDQMIASKPAIFTVELLWK